MDISNIYNLDEALLERYKEDPFPDNEARPGMKEFAQKFKIEITHLPTPYVMLLEGGYGVGKTYFITRFSEYLKKERFKGDTALKTVYINLWENDYVENPFSTITSQILYSLNPAKELQDSITKTAIQIVNNMLKFSAKNFLGAEIGNLLPNPKQDKEDLKNFKTLLKKLVDKNGGKVVLIIDEIDRCRPDYAVKALETIKHFFDIEGIFVILATKLDFMDSICEAYYGHPNCEVNIGEGYIQKFVQSKKILNPVRSNDYLFIVQKLLNKDTLPVMKTMHQGYPSGPELNSQLVSGFTQNMAKVFYESKLSIRKTVDLCQEIKSLIACNTDLIWLNKAINFSAFIIIKYLKAKKLIPETIAEPTWETGFYNSEYNKQMVDETLAKLLS